MDCRTFRKNLEDYLEDGLDFAGRFGMERHSQQCIGCGKDMADAQRIRRMVSELERVRAPESFESSVINEIGKRRLKSRAAGIRQLWIYGHEGPLWRKLALASSGLAVLAAAVFISFYLAAPGQDITSPMASEEPMRPYIDVEAMQNPDANAAVPPTIDQIRSEGVSNVAEAPVELRVPEPQSVPEWDATEAEYVEQLIMGADGRPMTVKLPMPRRIHFQYNQMSEDYYIQNISH